MTYYVYRLDNPITKEFYYGSRTCKCKIDEDDYMGSMVTWNPDKSKLIKTILKSNFRKRETCIQYESKLIAECINHPLNRNYYIPDKGFYNKGHSEETKEKIGNIHRGRIHSKQSRQNMSKGSLGIKHSEKTKKKMSQSATGYIKTIKHKENLSKNNAKYWQGKTMSESHIQKVAIAHMKPILQYTKAFEFIKEWISIKKASDILDISASNICWCCKNKHKSAGGYIWKYKNK